AGGRPRLGAADVERREGGVGAGDEHRDPRRSREVAEDLDGAPAAARVEVEEAASRAEERTESTRPLAVADLPRRAEGPLDGPALGGVPDVQGRGREP